MENNFTFKKLLSSNILLFLFLLTSFGVRSQSDSKTLKVTNNKNVTLIFPSEIRQAIVGSSNFNFSFDINTESKIGILKGTPGLESNLLVITKKGDMYSFILVYEKNITSLTYFVNPKDAIGNVNNYSGSNVEFTDNISKDTIIKEDDHKINVIEYSKEKEITENDFYEETEKFESDHEYLKLTSDKLYNTDKALYLKKFSGYIIGKPAFFKRYFTVTDNVYLSLNNIVFSNNEVFFYLEMENKGILDYDVNYINLYITSQNKEKRSSSQKLKYEPIYTYNLPKKIASFKKSTFVMVFSKFSIGNNKVAIIDINETKGERNLKLEISHKNINNPNSINN